MTAGFGLGNSLRVSSHAARVSGPSLSSSFSPTPFPPKTRPRITASRVAPAIELSIRPCVTLARSRSAGEGAASINVSKRCAAERKRESVSVFVSPVAFVFAHIANARDANESAAECSPPRTSLSRDKSATAHAASRACKIAKVGGFQAVFCESFSALIDAHALASTTAPATTFSSSKSPPSSCFGQSWIPDTSNNLDTEVTPRALSTFATETIVSGLGSAAAIVSATQRAAESHFSDENCASVFNTTTLYEPIAFPMSYMEPHSVPVSSSSVSSCISCAMFKRITSSSTRAINGAASATCAVGSRFDFSISTAAAFTSDAATRHPNRWFENLDSPVSLLASCPTRRCIISSMHSIASRGDDTASAYALIATHAVFSASFVPIASAWCVKYGSATSPIASSTRLPRFDSVIVGVLLLPIAHHVT